jgi:hypothetical protein
MVLSRIHEPCDDERAQEAEAGDEQDDEASNDEPAPDHACTRKNNGARRIR